MLLLERYLQNCLAVLASTGMNMLTCVCLRGPLEIVVWTYDTFYSNLEMNTAFTKKVEGEVLVMFWKYFSFKYFPNYSFAWLILPKLSGWFGLLWVFMG